MTTPAAPMEAAAGPKPVALWEDFVDVFTQPAAVFERRRDGRFGLALLALTVIAAALFFASRPIIQPLIDRVTDYSFQAQVRQGAMSAEQAAQARQAAAGFTNVITTVMAFVGTPMLVLVGALLLWLSGMAAGARMSFPQAMTVATYANVPRVVVGGVLGTALLAVTDVERFHPSLQAAPLGPAFLLGPSASPLTVALAQRFDLTILWYVALAAVGAAVMARVPRAKGATAAVFAWALGSLYMLYQGWKLTL